MITKNKINLKKLNHIPSISLIAFALLLANCERNTLELPVSSGNDPVFRLEMQLDNSPITAIAGVADVYNHTDYNLDQDEVFTFSGTLAPTDCATGCANSYALKLRNYQTGSNGFEVNQSLGPRSYAYKFDTESTKDAIELHLNVNTQANSPDIMWSIKEQFSQEEEQQFSQAEANDIRILNIEGDSPIFAKLTVKDEDTGLSSFLEREIEFDPNIESITSRIEVTQIENDSVALKIIHSSSVDFNPVLTTLWTVEDLDGQNPEWITTESKTINLRIGEGKTINNISRFFSTIDATRTSVGLDIKYDNNVGLIYHDTGFDFRIEKRIAQGSDLALQSFEFTMTDENGKLFSSAKGEQVTDSFFEILSIEPFQENRNGQETIKVKCFFSCKVFSDDGEEKTIRDAQVTIAIAIP